MALEILTSNSKDAFKENLTHLITKYGIKLGTPCKEIMDMKE